jgi:hypothetical protein
VEDYPYGFRLRTKIRYWIETTKMGDRFVSQTLNPKNGQWNKPKKSTYCKVGVMYLDENNHVKWTGLHGGNYLDATLAWLTEVGAENFTEEQHEQVKKTVAFSAAMEHVTFECKVVEYRHKETGEIVTSVPFTQMSMYEKVTDEEKEAEQELSNKNLGKLIAYEYSKL